MKLISCYIAHFGKIHDFSYDFNQGFNLIYKENGWGKTTFSVFIKAMFYGLEYSPKTKKKLLDRNHYLPWDGSQAGGNIVFSVKNKTYRIERSFGKTDKEDTFALFDQVTGLASTDYSEAIGEELFKVDRDSFEKSVYVPQLSLETAMTDSLNAKMGNLTSAKDDISNFDSALKAVYEAKSAYTRSSKVNPGKLFAIRQELSKCREDIEKLPVIEEGCQAQSQLLQEKHQRLENLTKEKNDLVEQIQLQSTREQELGAYRTYKANLTAEEEKCEKLQGFFAAGMLDDDELPMLEQIDRDLAVHEKSLAALEEAAGTNVTGFFKPFEEKVPTETQFIEWNNMATNLSELKAKAEHAKLSEESAKLLSELRFFFDKLLPTDEQLSYMERATTQVTATTALVEKAKENLALFKAEQDAREKYKKSGSRVGVKVATQLGIIIAVILAVFGIVFSGYMEDALGRYVEIVALVLLVVDIVFVTIVRKKYKKNAADEQSNYESQLLELQTQLADYEKQLADIKAECDEFFSNFLLTRADTMQENVYEIRRKKDQYNHLVEEEESRRLLNEETLDDLADIQLKLYTQIQPYASAYGINLYEMGGEFTFLAQLKKDADKFTRHQNSLKEMEDHKKAIGELSEAISKVLDRYPVDKSLSRTEQIHEISLKVSEYTSLMGRIAELKQSILDFESKHQLGQEMVSVDDLQSKQAAYDEQIVELNKQIIQDEENMNHNLEEIDRLGDVAEQIERLQIQEKEYREKAQTLDLTADFLQKAKESFLSRYMNPLQKGLHKYLGMIEASGDTKSGYKVEDFRLDMDLNIKLSSGGISRGAEYLSQGYQDIVAMCSRLALVDVLYSDEKPILILDDPFTNLDQGKIDQAMAIVKENAKERQTIYFTCHESRS